MATFDLESYATVQERIAQFYQDFPDGSIRTFMVVRDGPEIIFEARVFRNPEEAALGVYTSGFAREIEGKTPVNKTSHLENSESSSVGRALSNLGYATDARRPSRSEMLKVARMKQDHEDMLNYIRSAGAKVGDEATVEVGGKSHNLKEFVRKNWGTIKEQFRVARTVCEAIEAATDDGEARRLRERWAELLEGAAWDDVMGTKFAKANGVDDVGSAGVGEMEKLISALRSETRQGAGS